MNILVHACCAPCAAYCLEKLVNDGYKPTAYFYNPNIHPVEEHNRRLAELKRFTGEAGYPLIVKEDSPEAWQQAVKGLENEPEGGKRCAVCFEMRLEKAAIYAKENGFDTFTTVLTISPHKNSRTIHDIGRKLGEKHGISFLAEDFKKQDGFKKSLELSKKYGFYRQNYCGCAYSMR